MKLQWKSFKIDLNSFLQFLEASVPESEGIVACEEDMEVIEKTEFDDDTIKLIEDYYNSLTEV